MARRPSTSMVSQLCLYIAYHGLWSAQIALSGVSVEDLSGEDCASEEAAFLQQRKPAVMPSDTGKMVPETSCAGGVCPGMGNLFYLGKYDTSKPLTGGMTVLKERPRLSDCISYAHAEQTAWSLSTHDSMNSLVKSQSIELGIGGSFAPAAAVSLGLTVQSTTGKTSTFTKTFHSAKLQIESLQGVLNYDVGRCLSSLSNFTKGFLRDFNSLPLIDAKTVSQPAGWEPYRTFLQYRGSHMMVTQHLGSSFQQWTSSDSEETETATNLQIKACAKVEGVATSWSIAPCVGYSQKQKETSLQISSTDRRIVRGGTQQSRNMIAKNYSRDTLNAFIDDSAEGDAAIGYRFQPIWEILITMYRTKCDQTSEHRACENVQRALNLQAAYEGWISIRCNEKRTEGGNPVTYQQMQIQKVSEAMGHQLYQCWNHKEGCIANSDCHYETPSIFGCYCYGNTCFNQGEELPGGIGHFTGIQKQLYFHKDRNPNPSCHYNSAKVRCVCDPNWGGGLPSRAIYLQASGAR